MYIYLYNNVVSGFVAANDPNFPGIPIEQRYSEEFLNSCIYKEDITGIHAGMIYDAAMDTFKEPNYDEQLEEVNI